MPGRPADGLPCQSIIGDQGWRVAFATRPVLDIKISTDDMPNGLKQFLHRYAMAGSEIQGVAGTVVQEMLDRAGMRIGKIENVDEITHAVSVTRGIARA